MGHSCCGNSNTSGAWLWFLFVFFMIILLVSLVSYRRHTGEINAVIITAKADENVQDVEELMEREADLLRMEREEEREASVTQSSKRSSRKKK